MKRFLLGAAMALCFAGSAAAQCYPPPGLSIQQFYSMCRGMVDQGYAQFGGGMPYQNFVAMFYQSYLTSQAAPPMQPQMTPGLQQCALGTSMCFSGWFRTCQAVGNGTMWITGAQRC
jgi:opacity protein-like surface antigen